MIEKLADPLALLETDHLGHWAKRSMLRPHCARMGPSEDPKRACRDLTIGASTRPQVYRAPQCFGISRPAIHPNVKMHNDRLH
ncbi:hypothetical protein PISMIDRAFT_683772 [Pisolithus microcarpus 441]|uniref:Uncharacterized protein n=1 Tax=Pisolithus microcarpus 441 TaxID=765257 RepID=A0A0C9Z912_9AGAM|nr:hypothetical protein PISMIDRAFT_683772 [Pisolithus microcarpus 441]